MKNISLSYGEEISYKITGSGPAILHIHGSAFGHKNFDKLTPLMEKNFSVIDFDLPGYGNSTGVSRGNGIHGIADQVADFIRAINFSKLHIHGTSFGAMVALSLASRHPQLVDKLILSCLLLRYDNAARMMRNTWKIAANEIGMEAVADLTSVAGFARSFYDSDGCQLQLQSMRDAFAKTQPSAFISGTKIIEETDLSSLLTAVKKPMLLLAGEEDNMTPYKPSPSGVGMSHIMQSVQNCQLEVLKDCGHYLVIEKPEMTANLIHNYIH